MEDFLRDLLYAARIPAGVYGLGGKKESGGRPAGRMHVDANSLLVIEDSPVQAKIIRKQFEVYTDYTVLVAHSMAEAAEVLDARGENIFAAVADLNLPDAPDGEAVDLCRSRRVPCVVLTASFDETLRKRFLEKSVADYFLKGAVDDINPLISGVQRLYANRSVKALVVDDSATQRAIVKKMLAVQCIHALEAKDGVEALEVLAETPDVQLVITDFQMPRMDGIALVHEIRGKYKLSRMAIIGLSSAGSGPLTARFLKYGANDFLTKPFEAEEFYWRVNQNLNVLDVMEELNDCRRLAGRS